MAENSSSDEALGRARQSVRWVFWGRFLLQAVSLGFTVVLARLLDPAAFGLYGLVFVILQFVNQVESFRVESALVQQPELDREQLSAAWFFSIGWGLFAGGLLVLCSGILATAFGYPQLRALLQVGSAVFVIRSLFLPARVLLRRALRFRALTIVEVLRIVPSGAVAVWLAWAGYGAWALLAYYLLRELIGGGLLFGLARDAIRPRRHAGALSGVLHFGVSSTVSELLVYFLFNLPDLFIGRFIGAGMLGNYRQGVALVGRPVSYVDDVLTKLAFPVFSRAWGDADLVRSGFTRALKLFFAVTFPILGLTALLADELVAILYGSQWEAAVPVVRIMAIVGVARLLQPLNSSVFHAAGVPHVEARVNFAALALLVLLLGLVRPVDLTQVTLIVAVVYFAFAVVGLHFGAYLAGATWKTILGAALVPTVAVVGGGVVAAVVLGRVADVGVVLRVLLVGIAGIGSYGLIVWLLDRELVMQCRALVLRGRQAADASGGLR